MIDMEKSATLTLRVNPNEVAAMCQQKINKTK
jgi:hypothetical protein